MNQQEQHPDVLLAEFLGEVANDPLRYVIGMFPWNTEPSIQIVPMSGQWAEMFPGIEYGPDAWQCEWLYALGQELQNNPYDGKTAKDPVREAIVSGHGIGKSTLAAWLAKWILDTRPYSKGTMTANTSAQLRTKTWAEVGKWHNLSLTRDWFNYTNSTNTLSLVHKKFKETWACYGQTCEAKNSEAFAGQHAGNSTSFYIFDEASKIADTFFEVREGGMISGEPFAFDFGNGTRNTGRFFENCVGRFKSQYHVRSIDSREAYRTNKAKIAEDVTLHGEESDYVRSRWRGMFPNKASMQFLDAARVAASQERATPIQTDGNVAILGVDVARQGDDSSVIFPRIGWDCRTFTARSYKGLDSIELAHRVADVVAELRQMNIRVGMVCVDGGGGYGGGVVDQLRRMNIPVMEIMPGARAINKQTYYLRIDEMWGGIRENIDHLILPHRASDIGSALFEQLTQREFGYTLNGDQLRLEPKDSLRERLGCSPDEADALALTFGHPMFGDTEMDGAATFVPMEY